MELSTLFDLKHLDAFLLVAEEKHFGKAAARAFVATATMSTRIKDFETALGYEVFERTSRSVELTERGAALLEAINGPMAHLKEIFLRSDSIDRSDEQLNIAVVSDTDRNNVLAAINRLRTIYAFVRTERVNDYQLPGLMADRSYPVAISWSSLESLGLDHGEYESRELLRHDLFCVMPGSDPLASNAKVSAGDLIGRPIVLFHREIAPDPFDQVMSFLRSSGSEPELIAPQHSQASMADALDWNPRAVTFGNEANLPLLPERFVGVPVDGDVSTPIYAHASRDFVHVLDQLERFAAEY